MQSSSFVAAKRRYKLLRRQRDALLAKNEHDTLVDEEIKKIELEFPQLTTKDNETSVNKQSLISDENLSDRTSNMAVCESNIKNVKTNIINDGKVTLGISDEKSQEICNKLLEKEELQESHQIRIKNQDYTDACGQELSAKEYINLPEDELKVKRTAKNMSTKAPESIIIVKAKMQHESTVQQSERTPDNIDILTLSRDEQRSNQEKNHDDTYKSKTYHKNSEKPKNRYNNDNFITSRNVSHLYSSNAINITMFCLKVYNERQKPTVFNHFCYWVLIIQTLVIALLRRYIVNPQYPPGSYCLPSLFCLLTHFTLLLWLRKSQPQRLSLPMLIVYILFDVIPSFVFVIVIYVVFINAINLTNEVIHIIIN